MKKTKKIHQGYIEWKNNKPENDSVKPSFGKYHYFFSSKLGEISLVELREDENKSTWEIKAIQGDLFDDVEKYKSKKEAEERIEELLTGKAKKEEDKGGAGGPYSDDKKGGSSGENKKSKKSKK